MARERSFDWKGSLPWKVSLLAIGLSFAGCNEHAWVVVFLGDDWGESGGHSGVSPGGEASLPGDGGALAAGAQGGAGSQAGTSWAGALTTGGGGNAAGGGLSSAGGAGAGGAAVGGAADPVGGGPTAGGSGGAVSSGGSLGLGGAPDPLTEPQAEVLLAFLADQGTQGSADAVLELIRNEGASAAFHQGDFDYLNNPAAWDAKITAHLGADFPYLATVGNHDAPAWYGDQGYAHFVNARLALTPEMACTGEVGVRARCTFRGIEFIQSCVGTQELGTLCKADAPEQIGFMESALAASTHLWSFCLFHKNQSDMQLGAKTDEVGWLAYQTCMSAGAPVITGHEHSYSRTFALRDVGNALTGHGAFGPGSPLSIAPGSTFVVVSGLGGRDPRPYVPGLHDDDTWWAAEYTSDRWLHDGIVEPAVGTSGALFVRFALGGNPRAAQAYFKDVEGHIVDVFSIRNGR